MTIDSDDDTSYTVLFDKVIKPSLREGEWVQLQTKRSGITKGAYHNGIPYEQAIEEVRELLRDAIVVGHNVTSDFHALDLSIYSPAHCVFDTGNNETLNALVPPEAHKSQSKLSVLASSLLGMTIQQKDAHDPVEDALASLRLFLQHRHLPWEPLGDPESRTTLSEGRTIILE